MAVSDLASVADDATEVRHWPLQVVLQKSVISRGLWEVDNWSAVACESDRSTEQRQALTCSIEQREKASEYRWLGLALELFRDERAAYRFNIGSSDPRLFIVCNEDEEHERMEPFLITASQDVAASYMDGGEEDVYSVPMPEAIQCWIEGFIARHGEPELEVGKSKRRHHGRRKGAQQEKGAQHKTEAPKSSEVTHG